MFKSNRQCVRIHVTCKQQMPQALVFQAGGQNEVFAIPNTAAPFFVSGHGAILINNRKLFQQQVCDIKRYRRCVSHVQAPTIIVNIDGLGCLNCRRCSLTWGRGTMHKISEGDTLVAQNMIYGSVILYRFAPLTEDDQPLDMCSTLSVSQAP